MNIIVFSDLHIANKYVDDKVLESLINNIKSLAKPDSIICFCGDLMHKRVDLNDIYARQAISLCKEIDKLNIPSIFIGGTFSHDYNYIETFKKIELVNFKFIQTLTELEIKNNIGECINALIIPEEYVEDQQEYYKSTVYNKKKIYDLVLMHGTFTDVLFHNVSMESESLRKAPKFESKDFSRHTLTLSGHIHRHQILGKKKNVIYVGSYTNMNFGNDVSNNIHSIELDLENKSFNIKTIYNDETHLFEDIIINEDNIKDFESIILPKIKNKLDRQHFRVNFKCDDNLTLSILKDLKKEGFIKSLVYENNMNKSIEESVNNTDNEIDYKELYHGPLNSQIQTFIKETYNKDISIESINRLLS